MRFDGRKFADQVEAEVRLHMGGITQKLGRKPRLAVILNNENPGSVVYTNIKQKKAEELGVDLIKFQIQNTNNQINLNDQNSIIKEMIKELNEDPEVDGVMVQLPLTGVREKDVELCSLIDLEKDVDGLNPQSKFMPATVRAILAILDESLKIQNSNPQITNKYKSSKSKLTIFVVGNKGAVGSRVEKELAARKGWSVSGMDKDDFDPGSAKLRGADVVISATGKAGLIKPEMVKEGVILIDVGYPQGDVEAQAAAKASFFTPVPGGVGPVTVVMLFNNLLELVRGKLIWR